MWWIRRKKTRNNQGTEKQLYPVPSTLSPENAFTLIELMVAASILGLIGLAILTTFGSGFHVYSRVQTFGGIQADVLVSLEDMEKNLRNVFSLSSIAFEGEAQKISFPALIETIESKEEGEKVRAFPGQIAYYVDEDNGEKVLVKEVLNYSQSVEEEGRGEGEVMVIAPVEQIKFSYYTFDEKAKTYAWADSWEREEKRLEEELKEGEEGEVVGEEDGPALPVGVKIEIAFKRDQQEVQLTRTVLIPAGIKKIVEEEESEEGED